MAGLSPNLPDAALSTKVCFHVIPGAAPKIPIMKDIQDLRAPALVVTEQWSLGVTSAIAFELQSGMSDPEFCSNPRLEL